MITRSWNRFWFEADGRRQLRLFSLLYGLLLFFFYAIRSLDLELFYGDHAIMMPEALAELMPMTYRFSLFHHLSGAPALWMVNGVFLLSLLGVAFCVLPRLSVALALFLHLSFIHRDMAVAYGVDLIASFFLFYLCFADYRSDEDHRAGDWRAVLGSMAFRLCQVQVCVIYGYSGLKKLKGDVWWSGEGIWGALSNFQLARFDFSWLSHFPLLMIAAGFFTLAWEIYFPVLIWVPRLRLPYLLLGVGLHLGIAVGLGLPFFGTMMILTYAFFLDRTQAERGLALLRLNRGLPKVPSF